jgi:hypothetical protein
LLAVVLQLVVRWRHAGMVMVDSMRKEKRRKKKTGGAHIGRNGHFTRGFDTVSSELDGMAHR